MKTIWVLSDCEPLPCDDNPRLMRAGQLAEYMSGAGWKVVWWAPGYDHGKKQNRFDSTRTIAVDENETLIALYSSVVYKKNTSIKRIFFYKHLVKGLRKSFGEYARPDVIFCSWPTQDFAKEALKYGKENNVPVVFDVRDLWPDIFTRAFPEKLQGVGRVFLKPVIKGAKKLYKQVDSITAITPAFLKWGLEKAQREKRDTDRVIYIGYKGQDNEEFPEELLLEWKKAGVSEGTWNITYFGTFSESTLDMETCIKAFNEFSKKHDDARLILCGAGDASQKFKDAAAGNEKIVFPGWCSNAQIQSLLSISNVGLYPFKNLEDFKDTFGNKIIGYMAAGLPVMSSLEGFSKSYIDQYYLGKTYKESSVESCMEVMEYLYNDRENKEETGKRAKERFKTDFEMTVVNKQFLDLFNKLSE